ncbi:hypothetical protein IWQ60_006262 [Tieghemiomyces parasiticus]|uniref:Uncharacterized protein n=1 Tax=Tieghemiomyces parasiticus TaxID=78921 RepID=A0A9W8DY55_9FUNG|nr:hypothetical protein IWQ60_006262 [Tieghemiomyces parasiticus]
MRRSVLVSCTSPITARSLSLTFQGEEVIAMDISGQENQPNDPPSFRETYFKAEEQLLAGAARGQPQAVSTGVHLFHFSCTMPPVNFPAATRSQHEPHFPCPTYSIMYHLQARLELVDGEHVSTAPVAVHPEPISWPAHIAPDHIDRPLTLREGTYDQRRLSYHLQATLDRSAYCPGDTVLLTLVIKPVVNIALPHMGEVDLRERCECRANSTDCRQAADPPVWSRTQVLLRKALEFHRVDAGAVTHYQCRAALKIPATACPAPGVHVKWSYTFNVTLFEHREDRVAQSVGTFPLHLASGLSGPAQSDGHGPSAFPKHELQPISVARAIYQDQGLLLRPVLRPMKSDRRITPVSPGLLKDSGTELSVQTHTVPRNRLPASPTSPQAPGRAARGDAMVTMMRPKQHPVTMAYLPSDEQRRARAERSVRYRTCIIGTSRTGRPALGDNQRLLDIDVGESFEKLVLNSEFDEAPRRAEQLQAYLRTLTLVQPEPVSRGAWDTDREGPPPGHGVQSLPATTIGRARSIRHRTCVIHPSAKGTRGDVVDPPESESEDEMESSVPSTPCTQHHSVVSAPVQHVTLKAVTQTLEGKPKKSLAGLGVAGEFITPLPKGAPNTERASDDLANIRELERELEDILLNADATDELLMTANPGTDNPTTTDWEPNAKHHHLTYLSYAAQHAAQAAQPVNVYKVTTDVQPQLTDSALLKPKKKGIAHLTPLVTSLPMDGQLATPTASVTNPHSPMPVHRSSADRATFSAAGLDWEFVLLEPLPFQSRARPLKSSVRRPGVTRPKAVQFSNIIGIIDSGVYSMSDVRIMNNAIARARQGRPPTAYELNNKALPPLPYASSAAPAEALDGKPGHAETEPTSYYGPDDRFSGSFFALYEDLDHDDTENEPCSPTDDDNVHRADVRSSQPVDNEPTQVPSVRASTATADFNYSFLRPNELDTRALEVTDMIDMYLRSPGVSVVSEKPARG